MFFFFLMTSTIWRSYNDFFLIWHLRRKICKKKFAIWKKKMPHCNYISYKLAVSWRYRARLCGCPSLSSQREGLSLLFTTHSLQTEEEVMFEGILFYFLLRNIYINQTIKIIEWHLNEWFYPSEFWALTPMPQLKAVKEELKKYKNYILF